MVGDAIQQSGGHLCVAEHRDPLGKRQVGRDDQRGLLVKLADQVKQQRATRGRERQVARFIEDNRVGLD